MRYLPLGPDDVRAMLSDIGMKSLDDLFSPIPDSVKLKTPLNIPPALSEIELRKTLHSLSDENHDATKKVCLAGGVAYFHYIPSAVDKLASLPELLTAYTPYQPELSQGTLASIFEFQTVMCELTGLPVSNASLYDGSTAICEAARMTVNHSGKNCVAISKLVHPSYIEVLKSFASFVGIEVKVVPAKGDRTDADGLKNVARDCACTIVQSPNVMGAIEDIEALAKAAKEVGSYFVHSVVEAISLGLLKRPGGMGVDICCGEAQSFGNPVAFGGPPLGFITCTEEFIRRLPGRIVGESVDRNGNRALTLTLRPREQDIRREKATSNICTNNNNTMLRALIYLLLMGKKGLREVAMQSFDKAHYLAQKAKSAGFAIANTSPFFNELVITLKKRPANFATEMLKRGFVVSQTMVPGNPNAVIVAVTEMITKDEIDAFVSTLAEVAA